MCLILILVTGCSDPVREGVLVIYSGNIAGYLEPCPCPEGRVGGLSRFGKAVADSVDTWGDHVLVIDSGEFADPDSPPGEAKNPAILAAFAEIGYDAVNLCAEDLIVGESVLYWAKDTLGLPLISANLVNIETGEKLFPGWVICEVTDQRYGIIGLGENRQEDLMRAGVGYLTYANPDSALVEAVEAISDSCDHIIVLCDFPARVARRIGVNYSDISVIISSRDLMPQGDAKRYGDSYVLGVSRKGVRITSFILESMHCRFRAKLLTEELPRHRRIEEIIRDYREKR
ncbi:hypothetical protein CEE37_06335 [candidate division LCP-89 bacterium B3_LCP]|uniref:Uncharacterized protein n=1 Tax=candidate division LCP-89 bacterium B3_LCP TaxID=2012998 RepID=A0A532V247_UNCL8|nr:MAG: hypothetical protein CEE37_06335 [candidate division LCP-89 bacterium B3_LCP]